jgi:hypothetical protein
MVQIYWEDPTATVGFLVVDWGKVVAGGGI